MAEIHFHQQEFTTSFSESVQQHTEDADVRLTLLTSCQSGCGFCHLEAHKVGSDIGTLNPALVDWKSRSNRDGLHRFDNAIDMEGVQSVVDFCRENGVRSVHLTGGEPTLHPNILEIIRLFFDNDIKVGMTTHGEYASDKIEKLVNAGLSSLNFSIHALSPEDYLAMDLVAQKIANTRGHEIALRYAKNRLNLKTTNILLADSLCKSGAQAQFKGPKLNTVVQNTRSAREIVEWANQHHIPCRLQRDLNRKADSDLILTELIEDLAAKPVVRKESLSDSSGGSIQYITESGLTFKVKHFSPVFVEGMCGGCSARNSDACRENFYGLRLESSSGAVNVRACIDITQNGLTTWDLDNFRSEMDIAGSIPHALIGQYR